LANDKMYYDSKYKYHADLNDFSNYEFLDKISVPFVYMFILIDVFVKIYLRK